MILPTTMKSLVNQIDAFLNQAGAVQNTWYTVLNISQSFRIWSMTARCTVANETVEIELTVDGIVFGTFGADLVAGTEYQTWFDNYPDVGIYLTIGQDPSVNHYKSFMLEGQKLLIRMRKTTNAGASAIQCRVNYALWI